MSKFKIGDLVTLTDEVRNKYSEFPKGIYEIVNIVEIAAEYKVSFRYDIFPVDRSLHIEIPFQVDESWIEKANMTYESSLNVKTVSILGTKYTIVEKPLKDCDGYCDKTTKEIAIAVKEDDCDLGNFEEYRKKVLRHEIIHAYHYESGLSNNFENKQYGFSETLVDWFAIQSPKIFEKFKELDIL